MLAPKNLPRPARRRAPRALGAATVAIAGLVAAGAVLLGPIARAAAARRIGEALGVDAAAAAGWLDPIEAELELRGVTLRDPAGRDRRVLAVDRIEVALETLPLRGAPTIRRVTIDRPHLVGDADTDLVGVVGFLHDRLAAREVDDRADEPVTEIEQLIIRGIDVDLGDGLVAVRNATVLVSGLSSAPCRSDQPPLLAVVAGEVQVGEIRRHVIFAVALDLREGSPAEGTRTARPLALEALPAEQRAAFARILGQLAPDVSMSLNALGSRLAAEVVSAPDAIGLLIAARLDPAELTSIQSIPDDLPAMELPTLDVAPLADAVAWAAELLREHVEPGPTAPAPMTGTGAPTGDALRALLDARLAALAAIDPMDASTSGW